MYYLYLTFTSILPAVFGIPADPEYVANKKVQFKSGFLGVVSSGPVLLICVLMMKIGDGWKHNTGHKYAIDIKLKDGNRHKFLGGEELKIVHKEIREA